MIWLTFKRVKTKISKIDSWVNYTNILRAVFTPIFLRPKHANLKFKYQKAAHKTFVRKSQTQNVGETDSRTVILQSWLANVGRVRAHWLRVKMASLWWQLLVGCTKTAEVWNSGIRQTELFNLSQKNCHKRREAGTTNFALFVKNYIFYRIEK